PWATDTFPWGLKGARMSGNESEDGDSAADYVLLIGAIFIVSLTVVLVVLHAFENFDCGIPKYVGAAVTLSRQGPLMAIIRYTGYKGCTLVTRQNEHGWRV